MSLKAQSVARTDLVHRVSEVHMDIKEQTNSSTDKEAIEEQLYDIFAKYF